MKRELIKLFIMACSLFSLNAFATRPDYMCTGAMAYSMFMQVVPGSNCSWLGLKEKVSYDFNANQNGVWVTDTNFPNQQTIYQALVEGGFEYFYQGPRGLQSANQLEYSDFGGYKALFCETDVTQAITFVTIAETRRDVEGQKRCVLYNDPSQTERQPPKLPTPRSIPLK